MKLMRLSAFAMLLFMVGWLSSCTKSDLPASSEAEGFSGRKPDNPGFAQNDMVMFWNEKAAIVVNGPITPPAQCRYFAMIQIAVHDALNSIKPKYETYALNNHRVQFANPDAAVASAAYHTIKALNLQASHPIEAWYTESLATIPDGEGEDLGKALGLEAANAIISNRATDNFAMANVQAPGPDGDEPGEYKSTLPFSNPGMPKIKALHQWGSMMKSFVVPSNTMFRPIAPDPVNSVAYSADYNEVKAKGARINHTRTADESEIGVFWVERSTLGWNRFTRQLVEQRNMDSWKTARLFALLHASMMDGVTACFEAKYYYFYWRPETAVRLGDNDGNAMTSGIADWLPSYTETPAANIYTPPLPDYPSAHASLGGSAAAILLRFFGSDQISVNLTSPTLPNVSRHYNSITKAARDNSLSRIYVGYHFRKAVIEGEKQGLDVGNYVFDNSFQEKE